MAFVAGVLGILVGDDWNRAKSIVLVVPLDVVDKERKGMSKHFGLSTI